MDMKRAITYGSPMTKLSPALMEGTRPKEPTRAAAASLNINKRNEIPLHIYKINRHVR
jgi:hypothetical protein